MTTKPLIYDAGVGGSIEQFTVMVRSLERMGVSAVVIGPDAGSGEDSGGAANQIDWENLGLLVQAGKHSQVTEDFMFVVNFGGIGEKADAGDWLSSIRVLVDVGADALLVGADGANALRDCQQIRDAFTTLPLGVICNASAPDNESQWAAAGASLIVYPEQLLGAGYSAMVETARSILHNGCAAPADSMAAAGEAVRSGAGLNE